MVVMTAQKPIETGLPVESAIRTIRGERVILDSDLARIYGVSTKRLNEQVRRNLERFPPDFLFQVTEAEYDGLRSQIATSNENVKDEAVATNRSQFATGPSKHRDPRFLPYAFTEHGAIMAANVLNSPQAVQMSVFVVRAFIKIRGAMSDTRALAGKLAALESELKSRLDVHESAIVDILQRIMEILDPPPQPAKPEPPRRQIGFHAKPDGEESARRSRMR